MLSALDHAPTWLNTQPLTAADLGGRVVLVDFWTYSCVNWLRTLPYLRAWHQRYDELVVIGAHAPEFSFEHDLANVRRAVQELQVGYPVVIDNDFAIWRAFENHYWPAAYLLDGEGRVRFQHFGEGAYAEIERAIQTLLRVDEDVVDVVADGVTEAADWDAVRSPETYVGAGRGDARREPGELRLNQWALTGDWSVGEESALLGTGGGTIAFRFHARDLNLVLTAGAPLRFTVRIDGEEPGDAHGVDVAASGEGTLDEPRMYQLVRQPGPVAERLFELTFEAAGARAYVFTFG